MSAIADRHQLDRDAAALLAPRSSSRVGAGPWASGCPLADSLGNGGRACDEVGHQHDHVGRLALLINAYTRHGACAAALLGER
jgi:hypothetical protein